MSITQHAVHTCDGCGTKSTECQNWTRATTEMETRLHRDEYCPTCWEKMRAIHKPAESEKEK